MPESTGFETTNKHIQHITEQVYKLKDKYTNPENGESVILDVLSTSGSSGETINSNIGSIRVALQQPEDRVFDITTTQG